MIKTVVSIRRLVMTVAVVVGPIVDLSSIVYIAEMLTHWRLGQFWCWDSFQWWWWGPLIVLVMVTTTIGNDNDE